MDWVQMFLDFFAALVWPAAVGIILWVFRKEIRSAFTYLESLELPGGMKANFGKRLLAHEQQMEVATTEVVKAGAELKATTDLEARSEATSEAEGELTTIEADETALDFEAIERRIIDLAATSPSQAITELRFQALRAIRKAGPGLGLGGAALNSLFAAGSALKELYIPLVRQIGDIVINFNELSLNALQAPYTNDQTRLAFLNGNLNMPSLTYETLIFAREMDEVLEKSGDKQQMVENWQNSWENFLAKKMAELSVNAAGMNLPNPHSPTN